MPRRSRFAQIQRGRVFDVDNNDSRPLILPNFVWTDKTGSKVVFDGSGRLYQVLDRYQDGLEVSYVDSGTRIAEVQCVLGGYLVTDGSAAWLAFTYNSDSTPHVVAVSDSTGRTWSYSYNSDHRLVTVTAPLDQATGLVQVSYEYYPEDDVRQGLLKNVTDPNGGKTQYEYYANRRGMKVTDAEGNSHSISFNLYRDRTIFLDERQALTEYDHDSDGNVTQQINADQTTTVYTWLSGLKTSATDTFGQTEFYQYSNDGKGNLTQFTDRLGHSTVYTYSTTYSNLLTKTRQTDGLVTKYTYSDDGTTALDDGKSLWKLTNDYGGLGYITTYSYNWGSNRGLPNSIIKPKGYGTQNYKTTYTYNAAGQVTSQSTEDYASHWITTYYTYDSYGRGELVGTTDGKGASEGDPAHTTTYSYDLVSRRTKQTLPDPDDGGPLPAPVTVYLYDASGNMLTTSLATASPQQTVDSVYDNMNRVTKIVNADGTYRTMQYDGAGNVIAQTDELGRVTRFIYDPRNRLVATILPDGTTVSSQYDGGGRTVAATDAQGNTTRFEYDMLGRKTAAILPYDDPTKAVTVDQNVSGSGWTTVSNSGGLNNNYGTTATTSDFTTWTFNITAGHRYEVLATWVGDTSNTSAASYAVYDGTVGGTLKGTVPVNQKVVPPRSTVFTDTGWLSLGRYYISGTTLTVKLTNSDGGSLIADAIRVIEVNQTSYAYDPQGNLQYVVNALGSGTSDTAHTTEYRYDKLGRQKAVIQPDADGNPSTQDRPITLTTYDADGNVASVVDARGASDDTLDAYGNPTGGTSNDAAHTTQYTYDQMDRKIMVTLPDPDGNGSLTSLYTWFYYDANSNLEYVVNANVANASRPDTFQSSADYTTEYVYDALNRNAQEILPDPDGASNPLPRPVTNYTFDTTGNLSSVTNPLGAVTRYGYDLRNRQTQVINALGETTTTTLDALGNVIFVTDALGRRTDFEYDVLNRKVRQTLPLPDGTTNLLSQTTWQYDVNGNLIATTDPLGHTTWYHYDTWNRQVAVTDASGWYSGDPQHTTRTVYDTLGRVSTMTDPLGRTNKYLYDYLGRKTETIGPNPSTGQANENDSNCPKSYYGYDPNGNLKYTTDPLGSAAGDTTHTTWYFYDMLNRQVCTIDPLGQHWTIGTIPDSAPACSSGDHSVRTTYDALGNVLTVQDQMGRTTTYQYDYLGRKTATLAPQAYSDVGTTPTLMQATTTFAYDSNGNPVSTTDPASHTTWTVFDALNRPVKTVNALGSGTSDTHFATVTTFDEVGNVTRVTDPDGNTTQYAVDRFNRQTQETDPFWNTTLLKYDQDSNVVSKTDRDGRTSVFLYDPLGHKVEEDWLNSSSQIVYTDLSYFDAASQLVGSVNPGARYQYTIDADGRTSRTRMASGDLVQPTPGDNSGSLNDGTNDYPLDWNFDGTNEIADRRTVSLNVGDAVLLSLSSTAFNPVLIAARPDGTFLLDDNGGGGTASRLMFTADVAGTWTFFVASKLHSVSGQLPYTFYATVIARTVQLPEPSALMRNWLTQLDYAYYTDGRLQSVKEDWNNGGEYYQYDPLGRETLAAQGTWSGSTMVADKYAAFSYNDASQPASTTDYANVNGTMSWVATTSYTKPDGSSGYDGMGRLTNLRQTFDGSYTDDSWQYDLASRMVYMQTYDGTTDLRTGGYDAADQLKAVDYVGNWQQDEGYAYDQNGNRVGGSYSTGANNQLLSDGTYTYEYDKAGNRIRRTKISDSSVTEYQYDYRDRLTAVIDYAAGTVVEYAYDYLDRPVERYLYSGGSEQYTYTVFMNENPLLEVTDTDSLADNVTAGGTILETDAFLSHRYVYGPAADQIISVQDAAGNVRFGLTNQEGTVTDVVQRTSSTNWNRNHRTYDSFGKVNSTTDSISNFAFGLNGMALDVDAYLYQTDTVFYDPVAARRISEDWSRFDSGTTNLTVWAGNNPWNVTDPTGMYGHLISAGSSYSLTPTMPFATGAFGVSSYSSSGPASFTSWADMRPSSVSFNLPIPSFGAQNNFGGFAISGGNSGSSYQGDPGSIEALTRDWKSIQASANQAWATTKSFGPAVGPSFSDGRAWDSVQGTTVEMADSGADLAVAGWNTLGRAEFSVLNDLTGSNVLWDDYQRPGRLRDYTPALYGHTSEENQGAQLGDLTVRAQAVAAAAWGGASFLQSLPGLFGSAWTLGESLGAGTLVSGMGGGLGIGMLVPSSVGGYLSVGALGTTIAGVGAGIGALNDGGVFGPLSNWLFAKSSKTIRNEWEQVNNQPWPKDPATGANQDVSHKLPKADGGTDNLGNIEPKPHEPHIQGHKDNGDFSRWAKRRGNKP